jgi:hypothetical protein
MVTPEIDWWIKNVCQVKNPVYNRKRYIGSTGKTASLKTPMNQDDNIVLVLCTDYVISSFGVTAGQQVSITDETETNDNTIIAYYPSVVNTICNSNLYYLVSGERINFGINFTTGDVDFTVGYITISAKS